MTVWINIYIYKYTRWFTVINCFLGFLWPYLWCWNVLWLFVLSITWRMHWGTGWRFRIDDNEIELSCKDSKTASTEKVKIINCLVKLESSFFFGAFPSSTSPFCPPSRPEMWEGKRQFLPLTKTLPILAASIHTGVFCPMASENHHLQLAVR